MSWIKSTKCAGGNCLEVNYRNSSRCGSSSCVEVAYNRSTRCVGGDCVEVGYRTSTRCEAAACVEVAACTCNEVRVRDSKDPAGPVLTFTREGWGAFIDGIKGGDFD